MLLALATAALAQDPADWVFPAGNVIRPTAAGTINSAGHPSVVWDTERSRFIMVFEERTAAVDARCPQGVWRLRAAVSPDGVSWTVLDPGPTFGGTGPDLPGGVPGSGTYYSCVAANLTAVYSSTPIPGRPTGLLTIFFKAEQDTDACAVSAPAWGCDTYTGLGRQTLRFNNAGNAVPVTVAPATASIATQPILTGIPGATFGQPHAINTGGTWRLMVQGYPSIYQASGLQSASITIDATPVLDFWSLRAPTIPWVVNELFNPSYLCNDDGVADNLAMFVGGRDTDNGVVLSGAWAKAPGLLSTLDFVLDATPQVEWTDPDRWRHWEVTGLTNGEYLVYYSQKNAAGRNVIRVGGTTTVWSGSDVRSRYCN